MAEVSAVKHEKGVQKEPSQLETMIDLNRELAVEIIRLKTALHNQAAEIELLKKKLSVYDSL